jgi:putative two-component system response regulator
MLAGAALGALLVRERNRRRTAERFSAAALETLLRAIDANDPQTGAHVRRVASYSLILADAMDLSERERRTVELTALFHDVGKIHEALFDIVHEPRRLTPRERVEVAKHPARSAEVLAPIAPFHPRLADAVFAHHERWDGAGYPRGLRGVRIPLPARVVTIADTFDAITYHRRYRDGRTVSEALDIIQQGRGTQFDPEIVDLTMQPPIIALIERAHRDAVRRGRRLPGRRDAKEHDVSPKVHIRWRTRTEPSRQVRHQLRRPGR